MAITILDKSECRICGRILRSNEKIVGFPAFVTNWTDPMYFFNDEALHLNCLLNKHPLGKGAIELFKIHLSKGKPVDRLCFIGHNSIPRPVDNIYTGLLTSDPNNEMFKYNFTTFDRKNIAKWKDRDKFIEGIKKLKGSQDNAGVDFFLKDFELP